MRSLLIAVHSICILLFFRILNLHSQIIDGIPNHEDIWTESNRFACQCFCMATDYDVDSNHFALSSHSKFGYGVEAVPIRFEGDLAYWMHVFKKRQLVLYGTPEGVSRLHEFSVGLVVDAGPRALRNEREALLNQLSSGQYAYVKERYKLTGSLVLRNQLKQLQLFHGIPLQESHRVIYVHYDPKNYPSLEAKSSAWRQHCQAVCLNVVKQPLPSFHYQSHQEFAFMKYPHEPYDEGSWISSDPIHEGAIESRLENQYSSTFQAKQHWIKTIRAKYQPLFRMIRNAGEYHGFHPCNALQHNTEMIQGDFTDWKRVSIKYGIQRDPKDFDPFGQYFTTVTHPGIYFPTRASPETRSFSTYQGSKSETGELNLPYTLLPSDWINLNGEEAIRRKLINDQQQAVEWPKHAPILLAHQLGTQYKFKVRVQEKGEGFQVVSLFSGHRSSTNPMLTEFLHMFLDDIEAHTLKATLEYIILHHWAKTVLEGYISRGKKIGKQGGDSSVSSEPGVVGVDVEEDRLSQRSRLSASFIEKRARLIDKILDTSSFLQTNEIEPIKWIEIEFLGAIFLGCWQHASLHPGAVTADNKLAFVVKPTRFLIVQENEKVVDVDAESDSVAVQLIGTEKMGITRLSIGVNPSFVEAIKKYQPHDYKVIFQVLFNVFKVNQGFKFFERNTCMLNHSNALVEIGEYCKTDDLMLYPEINNMNEIKVRLTGAPLQKLVGEFMAKCYGTALPSSTVIQSKGYPPVKHKYECRKSKGKYVLIDEGPLQSPVPGFNALPKTRSRLEPISKHSTIASTRLP